MKNYLLLLVVFLVIQCKTQKTTITSSNSKEYENNSLLWRISGNGLEQSSFVYGTIHLIPKDDFFISPVTERAFNASDHIIFEIDLNEMQDFSNLLPILMSAYMPDGKTMKDLMSEKDYKFVEATFNDKGIPFSFISRIKPMFLIALNFDKMQSNMQTDDVKSYELEFMKMAETEQKMVSGLETIKEQMGFFDAIPLKEQAKILLESLKSNQSDDQNLRSIVDLYKRQEIVKLKELVTAEGSPLKNYENILIDQRNENWIPQIKTKMKEGVSFFAVGAGHLAGNKGVLNLLKQQGYLVEPILSESLEIGNQNLN